MIIFIFNYIKIGRRENEKVRNENSKPEHSPVSPDIPLKTLFGGSQGSVRGKVRVI
jgi:hypothetical protein